MDAYEVVRILYSRVERFEPENVSKIMRYLLFQDNGNQELLRLALSSDALLQLRVAKAKKELGLFPTTHKSWSSLPTSLQMPLQFVSDPQLSPGSVGSSESLNGLHFGSFCSARRIQQLPGALLDPFASSNESQYSVNVSSSDYTHLEVQHKVLQGSDFGIHRFPPRLNGSHMHDLLFSPSSKLVHSWKPCMYYARGYCKHGNTCRFLHSNGRQESPFSMSLNQGQEDPHFNENLPLWSLKKLEEELQELLRERRIPVSIASLPQLYFEKYGKNLQAEGYLTESQRHGKAGFGLTKLLARLRNTITLIDRPHGQHAVVLTEDAYKFLSYGEERDDLVEANNPGSHQIYLTFPPESSFTEEDVAAHFRVYGPVQDVRIPFQQKRMFGFVAFVYSETVKAILARGNPHYVCGARVLVKPYKEKSKHNDRKLSDRDNARFSISENQDYDFYLGPSFMDRSQILRSPFEEQAESLEMGRKQLAELQKAEIQSRHRDTESHDAIEHVAAEIDKLIELPQYEEPSRVTDKYQLQTSSAFKHLFDVLDSDTGEESNTPKLSIEGHNLPDSPFTSSHCEEVTNALFSEGFESLALGEQACDSGALTCVIPNGLICTLCTNFLVDPLQLDCKHMFCVECILKAIRVSKDECPLCQQHIGSQIVKLLESRGLRVIDALLTRGQQIIW